VIVISDSSPLITLARAQYLELLREFYGQVMIPREVHEEVTVRGAGLPGAEEVQKASWILVQPNPSNVAPALKAACSGLGAGEPGVIHLASTQKADLVLIDEARARRTAKSIGLTVAGSIAILERGARLKRVTELRTVYLSLLQQGVHFDHHLLEQSLARLGLGKLKK
jgi:predicted nucleic acid-binding protein